MEVAREGSGVSVSQPHALEEVGEPFSNQYIYHTSGSEVGNHKGVRVGSHPHMSPSTQAMNPPFQQMDEFFHHMAKAMNDPNVINFEKMRKMGGVEFEGTVDPTDAEQWLERMERVFEQLECSDVAKFKEFHMKYVPPAYCDAKRNEFLNLRQLGISIVENQQGFLRLSRYDGVSAAFTWERLDKEEASSNENKFRKPRPDFGGPLKRGRRASGACFNCGRFDHKVKDCPNPNNAPFLKTEGSVHKPSINPHQTNRGARLKNTQAASTNGANQASGQRDTARA
ncbi:hypothetical protein KY290_031766 [Solanum tuberosum]|uniref:CCHC-type domain-containing protein n=1 Tax=Solanum tuberosum TaxID=4113 RepID=A0ABQ7UA93_SOLTU|nr:hypothetical protein KY284_030832 [Solanum tuberosum]KAH0743773.1 hypothetical protein KY290_031766 [Solanum tuberosum]